MSKQRPTLLYASPFPPMQSGISDYSVVLVKALQQLFDITLYTDDYRISDKSLSQYPVLRHGRDSIPFDRFRYIIYNIGNNPEFHQYIYESLLNHPGMVILHDMVIFYLFVGYYLNKDVFLSATYEKQGLADFLVIKDSVKRYGSNLLHIKSLAAKLPMNRELLASGNRIMVHSRYAREEILKTRIIEEKDVAHINMICQIDDTDNRISKDSLFEKYGVPKHATVVASFGHIAETKLNQEICMAVRHIRSRTDMPICYVMVGQGDYANAYLEDGLIIKTDYVELHEFNAFIKYADIVVNMRYPSMGETSAALLRILQTGKACITNNGGWFSEIPDDCVFKVDLDDKENNIENAILRLMNEPDLRDQMEQNAIHYIEEEFRQEVVLDKIAHFLTRDD